MRSALAAVACLMLLAPAASAACADAGLTVPASSARGAGLPAQIVATVCVINEERAARGLGTVTLDTTLMHIAYGHAADMLDRRFFSHTGSDGSNVTQRIVRGGYPGDPETWLAAENLGWATATLATPRAIVDAWLASPAHREVMLEPLYPAVGVVALAGAPADDAATGATYVAEFGTRTGPALDAPAPVAKPRPRTTRRCRLARAALRSAHTRRNLRRVRHCARASRR
jgi:uncharacterized protein YkwD